MLYGKCIFSQSGTTDFKIFWESMDPPDSAPLPPPLVVPVLHLYLP
jgi:hypothetical protein